MMDDKQAKYSNNENDDAKLWKQNLYMLTFKYIIFSFIQLAFSFINFLMFILLLVGSIKIVTTKTSYVKTHNGLMWFDILALISLILFVFAYIVYLIMGIICDRLNNKIYQMIIETEIKSNVHEHIFNMVKLTTIQIKKINNKKNKNFALLQIIKIYKYLRKS